VQGLVASLSVNRPLLAWVLIPAVLMLGVAGLAGWRDDVAITVRALLIPAVATVLAITERDGASSFVPWVYVVVAVYPLALVGWRAYTVGPLAGALLVAVALVNGQGDRSPPWLVGGLLQVIAILLVGLLVAAAGRSLAESRRRAEVSGRAADAAGAARDRSAALLETYFANAATAMAYLDDSGRYVQVNAAMERVHGLPAWAVEGRTPAEVFPDVPGMQDIVDKVLASARATGPTDITVAALGRQSAPRAWRVTAHPVKLAGPQAGAAHSNGRPGNRAVSQVTALSAALSKALVIPPHPGPPAGARSPSSLPAFPGPSAGQPAGPPPSSAAPADQYPSSGWTTRALELPDSDAQLVGVGMLVEDVTERARTQHALEHAATHDALTGLPNRSLFAERLSEGLARAAASAGLLAVLFLDVDRFKTVNDSLGHVAGDELLVLLSERVTGALRPSDTVSRLGGDEFAVLCEDIVGPAEAEALAERVLRAVGEPLRLAGRRHVVSVSVGIAVSDGNEDPDDLLRSADVALYEAKAAGRNRYAVHDDTMRGRAEELLALEQELREAVSRGEVSVAYQPIISVATGAVVSAEALARWRRTNGVEVPPVRFIPLAEELGVLDDVTRQVLRTALHDLAWWRREIFGEIRSIAVNVTARQLADPELPVLIRAATADAGLPFDALTVEVTEEGVMSQVVGAEAGLAALRELGVRVAVDDFGTGYSCLANLGRFPITTLKIDRALLAEAERDLPIIRSVVSLGHALGLDVVAEGVERPDQLALLADVACDAAQGSYVGEPMDADTMADYLAETLDGGADGLPDYAEVANR
jgi:diguanylate cyclase (GGDEF)-like protein